MKARQLRQATLVLTAIATISFPAWAGTVAYDYDVNNRLVRAVYPGDTAILYEYDPTGNIVGRFISTGAPIPLGPTLMVGKSGTDLVLDYPTSSCNASEHTLFVGSVGSFSDVTSAVCMAGNTGSIVVPDPGGAVWFLVGGREGDEYSSVGTSLGFERMLAGVDAACPGLAQNVANFCPAP